MDDETWLKEQDKKLARERAAKANALLSDLDRKSPPQEATRPAASAPPKASPAAASSSSAYVPPSWETKRGGDKDGDAAQTPLCGFDMSPPTERSFESFFKQWFIDEHFPMMSELLKKELVFRAKQKGFLSGLSSQFKKWAMSNTDPRLQADVWYSYFTQDCPPKFRTYLCFRTATVNLGAKKLPHEVTFYGYPEEKGGHWMLMPWTDHQGEVSAILDEIDGQGGLQQFLTSTANVAAGEMFGDGSAEEGEPAPSGTSPTRR
eukprot:CAMPEP_0178431892 /NCGR_PEP_ID=MMETSP0689_2-20121128/32097_1 /TAXON_ID=160604 /ORGANISM="Amphidinium massartii, Strain CS-259" /LENGTH=261 /DNA_ID=CAMNT_0020053849 /DNA_START=44 /DNA_END=829 /DNA_ORIENTATION=-